MKKEPKVSIIIPVYNGSDYIKEAIDSALKQTYKNIEIIVVNDGSNDGGKTERIINKYYKDKVKYYSKENGGVSTALNLALKEMTGDYFSWLSHDDRYYENKIESQIKYLENFNKNTILYSDYDFMDEYSNIFSKSIANHKELIEKPEYALLKGAINGITLLIPKKAFEDCGNFREDLRCTQDYDLWLRMMDKYEFVHQPEILATSRLHANQVGNTSPKMLTEGYDLWVNIIEKFPDSKKIELEKNIYSYYYKILEFIKLSPYKEVEYYLENKLNEFQESFYKELNNIKVSIVLPYCTNNENLSHVLNSFENQSHTNIELLIIDNGLDMKEKKKLLKNPKIKIIKNVNSSVLDLIAKNASGSYISIIDSNTEFLSNKIEKQLEFMLKNNVEVSFTSYKKNGVDLLNNYFENKQIINEIIVDNKVIKSTLMFKLDVLNKCDKKIELNKNNCMDDIFLLEILKQNTFAYINESFTNMYENSEFNELCRLKNTIKYLFVDEYYSNFELELAEICNRYYNLFYKDYSKNIIKNSNNLKFKKYINILLKKGPIYCIKKLMSKLKGI